MRSVLGAAAIRQDGAHGLMLAEMYAATEANTQVREPMRDGFKALQRRHVDGGWVRTYFWLD